MCVMLDELQDVSTGKTPSKGRPGPGGAAGDHDDDGASEESQHTPGAERAKVPVSSE